MSASVFDLQGSISMDSSEYEKAVKDAISSAKQMKTAFVDNAKQFTDMQKQIDSLSKELKESKDEISRLKAELDKSNKIIDDTADSTADMKQEIDKAGTAAEKTAESTAEMAKETEKSAEAAEEMSSEINSLKTRLEVVNSQYKESVERVEELRRELEKTAKESGVNAEETRKLASELEKAEAESHKLEKKVEELEKQYDSTEEETEELKKDTKDLGDTAEKTKGKFADFADFLKNGLVTGIKVGIGAIVASGTAIAGLVTQSVSAYGEFEQLKSGAEKIFEGLDFSKIQKDADNAFKELNMSASEYYEAINLAGASFTQTMGSEKGYETARKGMLAISDFASGTGKSIDELNQKYQMITRSMSSYQSIADQFSGILPQTSEDFLTQAQAAGFLSEQYKKLTDVPVAEYQEAVTNMLEKGVAAQNLSNNTAREAGTTLTGSIATTKKAWEDLVVAFSDPNADLGLKINNFVESATGAIANIKPTVEKALEGISTAIQDLAPIVGTEAPKLIADIFPSLLSSATSLVTKLVESISNLLPDLLKNIFSDDMINQLLDSGETILKSLLSGVEKITEIIKSNLPDFVKTIGLALVEGSEILLDSALEILLTLADAILDSSDEFFDVISNLITMLGDFISRALPELIPKVYELVYGLIESLSSSDILSQLTMVVIPLLTAIADGLIKAAPIVYDKLPKIITNIFDMLTKFVDEHGDEVFSQLETLFETIIEGAIELTPQLLQAMGDIITALVNGVIEYVPTFVDTVAGFFGYDNFSDMGQNVIDGILDAITGGIENIKTAASDIFNAVVEWLEQLPERAGYIFGQILGYIVQWAVDAPEKAKEAAENLFNGIVEWVQQIPDNVSTFLNDTLPKVVDWGLNLMEKGKSAAKDLFDSIVNKIEELPGKMLEIGDNLVKGIWDGITGAKDWLLDQISGFADGVVSGFKDSFGIKSPSTLMRDVIGENLALGVGVGFNKEIDDVTRSMSESLESGINAEIKPIEITSNFDYEGIKIDEELDNIARSMSETIESGINTEIKPIEMTSSTSDEASTDGRAGNPTILNVYFSFEGANFTAENGIEEWTNEAVEKMSERLAMLGVFEKRAIGE